MPNGVVPEVVFILRPDVLQHADQRCRAQELLRRQQPQRVAHESVCPGIVLVAQATG